MLGKAVLGILLRQLFHLPVTGHLGHDAGGGDGIGHGVAVDNGDLRRVQAQIFHLIDQIDIGLSVFRRPAHGVHGGLQDVDFVDFLGGCPAHTHIEGGFQYFLINQIPPLGGQLLTVVHPVQDGLGRHDDAGRHHVSGQRAAARLVHARHPGAGSPVGHVMGGHGGLTFHAITPHRRFPPAFPGAASPG